MWTTKDFNFIFQTNVQGVMADVSLSSKRTATEFLMSQVQLLLAAEKQSSRAPLFVNQEVLHDLRKKIDLLSVNIRLKVVHRYLHALFQQKVPQSADRKAFNSLATTPCPSPVGAWQAQEAWWSTLPSPITAKAVTGLQAAEFSCQKMTNMTIIPAHFCKAKSLLKVTKT